jgi:hypothetical protein
VGTRPDGAGTTGGRSVAHYDLYEGGDWGDLVDVLEGCDRDDRVSIWYEWEDEDGNEHETHIGGNHGYSVAYLLDLFEQFYDDPTDWLEQHQEDES